MKLNSNPESLGPPCGISRMMDNPEMLFYLYLPVKLRDQSNEIDSVLSYVPHRLQRFNPIIRQCLQHERRRGGSLEDRYVYLTVKTLFVTPEYIGGRPGWHTDGFGTDDVNYIWASDTPTEFCIQEFDVSEDEHVSIADMTEQADPANIHTFGDHLLRITPADVHRCPIVASPRLRTFFRLSISKERYNMAGNSHNYLLDYEWDLVTRGEQRNKTAA